MPFQFNEAGRHRLPKARHRVRNRPDDDRGFARRCDIRIWLSKEAIAGWRAAGRTTPGGQRRFSNPAVETTSVLDVVLRLPLRQAEGLIRSLMAMMKLDLAVPDHAALARRRRTVDVGGRRCPRKGPIDIVIDSTGLKVFGAREWARAKPGETRRSRRKLHLLVGPASQEIVAHELTDDEMSDAAMIAGFVANSGGKIRCVIAGGADDGEPTYQAIRAATPKRSPPKIAIRRAGHPFLTRTSRMAWQRRHGCGKRLRVETAISRIRRING